MIIVVGGIKGGSGKTTVATNLAVIRSLSGQDVLLVDADDQESASDFSLMRNETLDDKAGFTCMKQTEKRVRTEVLRLSSKFDEIIIDTGGRDTASQRFALSIADILLIPFLPRSYDIWTLGKVRMLVEEAQGLNENLKAMCFLNRADPMGVDNDETKSILKDEKILEYVDAPMGSRKAFARAATQGLGIVELRPVDTKASEEMTRLCSIVFS
jgi:chromosome partitioning protein